MVLRIIFVGNATQAAVRERDQPLDMLLKLAACMGGSFTHSALCKPWRVLAAPLTAQAHAQAHAGAQSLSGQDEAKGLDVTIQRGVRLGLLKYLSPSGVNHVAEAGQAGRRRSSAQVGMLTLHTKH